MSAAAEHGRGPRAGVYYWKCDRPAALHGVRKPSPGTPGADPDAAIAAALKPLLVNALGDRAVNLRPGGGKGNHRTFLLDYAGGTAFVRVEDGPEGDGHLAVESRVLEEVRACGVPVPGVIFTDASRRRVPFAVQVIEYLACPDLNALRRTGRLQLERTAREIGRNVALWQSVPVAGFGPFDPEKTEASGGRLTGYHSSYAAYFTLHLDRHLALLAEEGFLSHHEARAIRGVITEHAKLLELGYGASGGGYLVHKDLALWNILGTEDGIRAFIDWDDAIAGDPTDDVSLPACFYPPAVAQAVVEGYASRRPLPVDFSPRYWLHLLRNMVVKAVIRCGAGYFAPASCGAFLMDSGQDGPAFRAFTRQRLMAAYTCLRDGKSFSDEAGL